MGNVRIPNRNYACMLVAVVLSLAVAAPAYAQQRYADPSPAVTSDNGPVILAWYRFDPSTFATSSSGMLPLMLRLAESQGLIRESFRPIFDGLLAAGVLGAVPHSVTLLDLAVEVDTVDPGKWRLSRLHAVIVLETQKDHRSLLDSLRTIVTHYDSMEIPTEPELFATSDGSRCARFRAETWPDWQAIEWASMSGSSRGFIVGIGNGSIERWLGTQRSSAARTIMGLHRDSARSVVEPTDYERLGITGESSGQRQSFLEVWANLDGLRQQVPEAMGQGLWRRMLVAWQLDNARDWMLHASRDGKYLTADVTWRRRSDPPEEIMRRPIALAGWPTGLNLPRPPGDFMAVVPVDLEGMFERILAVYRATMSDERAAEFDRSTAQYRARHRRTLTDVWAGVKPWLIVGNYPTPPVAVPGACTLYFELTGDAKPSLMHARVHSLLRQYLQAGTVEGQVIAEGKPEGENEQQAASEPAMAPPDTLGQTIVRYDRGQELYWLQVESSGLLRVPSWGWSGDGRHLIAGWAPVVVTTNREWLGMPPP